MAVSLQQSARKDVPQSLIVTSTPIFSLLAGAGHEQVLHHNWGTILFFSY